MSIHSGALPIGIVEEPSPALAQWTAVERCPVCGSQSVATSERLPDRYYVFGAEEVPFPENGIAINGCGVCGVYYKATVPSPAFLAEMFARYAESTWSTLHDYSRELAIMQRLWGRRSLDLLDIGAANGALLKAHAAHGMQGRRSAFDVMRYAGLSGCVTGEFIEGFLDDPLPSWSGQPYDVVSMFDVLEHLYRPRDAFQNLRALTRRGGLVFIETGNAASLWPRRFGVNEWWYVRLLEHHVFWTRRALEHAAADHGFKVVHWADRRHKSRRGRFSAGMLFDLAKTACYCMTGRQYAAIAQAFGRHGNQPWFPFTRDHFQACLMRA